MLTSCRTSDLYSDQRPVQVPELCLADIGVVGAHVWFLVDPNGRGTSIVEVTYVPVRMRQRNAARSICNQAEEGTTPPRWGSGVRRVALAWPPLQPPHFRIPLPDHLKLYATVLCQGNKEGSVRRSIGC